MGAWELHRSQSEGDLSMKQQLNRTRRQFMATTIGSSLALIVGGRETAGAVEPSKPNILFILADDMGVADLSCYGRRDYQTPNIDRLAREGLKLTHSYANCANCSPTRFGLITGRYQGRVQGGLFEPLGERDGKENGLPPSHPTLPSLLKKQGYETTLIGKWDLGLLPKYSPLRSGYDHFFGVQEGGLDYFRHGPNDEVKLMDQEVPSTKTGYATNLFADRAIETIKTHAKSKVPFFISLHFNAPHWPWEGPDDEELAKNIKNPTMFDGGSLKTYAAMMKSLDDNVGRVLKALEESKLATNTIVIFTSDNGGERFSDMWPHIGKKGELLEGGLRVPNIIRWPGKIKPNTVSDQANITMDWFPTLLAVAGGQPDPLFPTDGENLLPVYMGQAKPHTRKLFWRMLFGGQRAVLDGNWKYLRLWGNEFLFDVNEDPRERANLKDKHPEVMARLQKDWETWNASMLPYPPGPGKFQGTGNNIADRPGMTPPPATPTAHTAPTSTAH